MTNSKPKPKGPRPASTYRGYRRNHKIGGTHQWQTTPHFGREYVPPTRPNQKVRT